MEQQLERPTEGSPEAGANVYRSGSNLVPYPYFSLEERDRRWRLMRAAMAQ